MRGSTIPAAPRATWPLIPPLPTYGRGRDHEGPRYTSFLHGEHLENITIRGKGESSVIDGVGRPWWDEKAALNYTRGHLIEFMYCTRIRMYHMLLQNSPYWTNHFYDCDDVHVHHVTVDNRTYCGSCNDLISIFLVLVAPTCAFLPSKLQIL